MRVRTASNLQELPGRGTQQKQYPAACERKIKKGQKGEGRQAGGGQRGTHDKLGFYY